jgi:L-lactate dehydrogenase complex protein LldF
VGARIAAGLLGALGRRKGRFRTLPLARGWTAARDFPAPAGRTFMDQWAHRQRARRT